MRRWIRRDPLLLILLLLLAVVLLTLPRERQLQISTLMRSTVLAPVIRMQSGLSDLRLTRDRIERIRAERDTVAVRLLELEGVEEENARLRALLGLAERMEGRYIPANLYPAGRTAERARRSFVLDVGAADGISADAAVVAPGGLVGVVRAVTGGQATGDFWTHPEFRVSAMTADGQVFGIIRSLGGMPPRMSLDGTPYQAELAKGTLLVTSGLGGVFPRGIPVGRIARLTSARAGWAKSYEVVPAVHPAAAQEVLVLAGHPAPGRAWAPDTTAGTEER